MNLTNADILKKTSDLADALDRDAVDPIKVKTYVSVLRTNMQAMNKETELHTRMGLPLKERHRKYYGLDEEVRDVTPALGS